MIDARLPSRPNVPTTGKRTPSTASSLKNYTAESEIINPVSNINWSTLIDESIVIAQKT